MTLWFMIVARTRCVLGHNKGSSRTWRKSFRPQWRLKDDVEEGHDGGDSDILMVVLFRLWRSWREP